MFCEGNERIQLQAKNW